jgi:hypothetical protein
MNLVYQFPHSNQSLRYFTRFLSPADANLLHNLALNFAPLSEMLKTVLTPSWYDTITFILSIVIQVFTKRTKRTLGYGIFNYLSIRNILTYFCKNDFFEPLHQRSFIAPVTHDLFVNIYYAALTTFSFESRL